MRGPGAAGRGRAAGCEPHRDHLAARHAEGGTIQAWKAFAYPPFNRYTAASALLAPATTADAHMFDASEMPYRIGVAQWIFGLLGALTVLRPGRQAAGGALLWHRGPGVVRADGAAV